MVQLSSPEELRRPGSALSAKQSGPLGRHSYRTARKIRFARLAACNIDCLSPPQFKLKLMYDLLRRVVLFDNNSVRKDALNP
jgi:hypothetical protein